MSVVTQSCQCCRPAMGTEISSAVWKRDVAWKEAYDFRDFRQEALRPGARTRGRDDAQDVKQHNTSSSHHNHEEVR